MLKRILLILTCAGAVCAASAWTDSGTLEARHRRGYGSYYGGPYIGGARYYSGYRGYRGYGWGGPGISIRVGTYPRYYRYGGYGGYGVSPYYGGYSSGVYYRSPVIYGSPVVAPGYYGYGYCP